MKKAPKVTSDAMAGLLAERGIKLNASAVRRWWQRGASKSDPDKFLQFYRRERHSEKTVPRIEPTNRLFALVDNVRALPLARMVALEDRAIAAIEGIAEGVDARGHLTLGDFNPMCLAMAAKKLAHCAQILAAECAIVELERRPGGLTEAQADSVRAMAKIMDVGEITKFVGLPNPFEK